MFFNEIMLLLRNKALERKEILITKESITPPLPDRRSPGMWGSRLLQTHSHGTSLGVPFEAAAWQTAPTLSPATAPVKQSSILEAFRPSECHNKLCTVSGGQPTGSQDALGWKGPSEAIQPKPPAVSRDIFTWVRLLRAPSNLALNVSRDGASTTSLGNLGQGFTTLMVKNFFLISKSKTTLL